MSNYTVTTDFGFKDTLLSGNLDKIIKGAEFTTEFNNIATAVATKADTASPTFTGTVTIGGVTYPTSDGTANQVLTTDGAGNLSFATPASGFDPDVDAFNIGNGAVSSGTNSIALGHDSQAGNQAGISIGHLATSTQPDAVLLGRSTSVLGTGGVAVGATADTSGLYSVAVGYGASATDIGSVAMGHNSSASAQFATAIGRDASANLGSYNTALGYGSIAANFATAVNQATASGSRSVAVGHSATASAPDSVAIGYQSSALGTDAVGIGNLAGADAANAIHINASGVITNQPQGNGNIVIESSTAKLAYDGNWDLSTGDLTVNGGVEIGTNWKVRDNGLGVLIFSTGGVDKMKLDASGNLTVVGNVTAFGTI